MAEKKTERKTTEKVEKDKKPVEKKVAKKTTKSTEIKKAEIVETKEPVVEKTEEPEQKEKKSHKVVWAVVITSVIWLTLFILSFFLWLPNFAIGLMIENGWDDIDFWRLREGEYSEIEEDIEDVYPRWKQLKKWLEEKEEKEDGKTETEDTSSQGDLIDNPNARVTIKGARLVEVGDLEIYLPMSFKPASTNGKSNKYVYNLEDDDGWADVKIYVEETTKDLGNYMTSKDSLLKLKNSTYYMNGTSWMEMESGSSLAYGTRLGDKIYMVILNTKLESDDTAEAASMIPKTLRLKKIYKLKD